MGTKHNHGHPYKKKAAETDTAEHSDRGRDWNNAAFSPRILCRQELGEAWNGLCRKHLGKRRPARLRTSSLQNCEMIHFCCLEAAQFVVQLAFEQCREGLGVLTSRTVKKSYITLDSPKLSCPLVSGRYGFQDPGRY